MTNHPTSANHNHIDHIDLLRIVAAFLVIVNHTNSRVFLSNAPSLTWFSSLTYFFVSKIAVPLFLLIMGALLLGKQDSTHKSISRFLRILIVGFVFSIVYFVFYHRHDLSINLVPEFLIQVWRGPITNAYWYLYLYLGLLLILPLLQRMAAAFSRAHIQYLVFISVIIVGTYPLFSIFFPYRPSSYFFASLFSTDIGLLFAGYYIERFMQLNRKTFFAACAGFVFLIAFQVITTWHFYKATPNNYLALDNRTLFPITGSAICFYVIIKYLFHRVHIPEWLLHSIRHLGNLTFGIYLLSDIVINRLEPFYAQLFAHIHVLPAMLIWEICIFLICSILAAILKSIPGLKKWI